jgi:glycosyltransferase involved in cell wall biosynthesis
VTIIVLVPAYQEAPRIGAVVEAATRHLPVVVVDDGSTDGTADIALRAGADVVRQEPNQGKGGALRRGFTELLARGADAAITLDADGQHDPSEIPAFVEAWQHGHADLLIGRRDFRRMPVVRRLSNLVGGAVLSWAVGQHVPDNQSGFRLVGRKLMEASLGSRETGFEFEVELIATCIGEGMRLEWLPIRTIYGGGPSHIRPVHHLRSFLRITLDARRRVRAGNRG